MVYTSAVICACIEIGFIILFLMKRNDKSSQMYESKKKIATAAVVILILLDVPPLYYEISDGITTVAQEIELLILYAFITILPAIVVRLYLKLPLRRTTAQGIAVLLTLICHGMGLFWPLSLGGPDYDIILPFAFGVASYLIMTKGDQALNNKDTVSETAPIDTLNKQLNIKNDTVNKAAVKNDAIKQSSNSKRSEIPSEQLKQLKKLHDAGILTDEEFSEKKKQILNI